MHFTRVLFPQCLYNFMKMRYCNLLSSIINNYYQVLFVNDLVGPSVAYQENKDTLAFKEHDLMV